MKNNKKDLADSFQYLSDKQLLIEINKWKKALIPFLKHTNSFINGYGMSDIFFILRTYTDSEAEEYMNGIIENSEFFSNYPLKIADMLKLKCKVSDTEKLIQEGVKWKEKYIEYNKPTYENMMCEGTNLNLPLSFLKKLLPLFYN